MGVAKKIDVSENRDAHRASNFHRNNIWNNDGGSLTKCEDQAMASRCAALVPRSPGDNSETRGVGHGECDDCLGKLYEFLS